LTWRANPQQYAAWDAENGSDFNISTHFTQLFNFSYSDNHHLFFLTYFQNRVLRLDKEGIAAVHSLHGSSWLIAPAFKVPNRFGYGR
jgi:hypothetical protein